MRPSLLIIILLGVLSLRLSAQADSGESAEYKEAVTLGLAEFDAKNFMEARVHFARAHELEPSARTLRALGMIYFELKEYVEAQRYLSDALRSTARPLDADKRDKTEKLRQRAASYVAQISLDLDGVSEVTIDGKRSSANDGDKLALEAGEHTLEFSGPGRITERRNMKLLGGTAQTVRVHLAELTKETPSPAVAQDTNPREERRPVYKNPWLWTVLGVVVVGAAAGTAVYLTREPETRTPYGGSTASVLTGVGP